LKAKATKNLEFTLKPVAEALAKLLGKPVQFLPDCIGAEVEAAVAAMAPGSVVLLENVRFYAGEEKNDPEFSRLWPSSPMCSGMTHLVPLIVPMPPPPGLQTMCL
jgi:3-phosphoglycerate kinase